MLGALVSFLLIYAIYVFIDWLRNSKKNFLSLMSLLTRGLLELFGYTAFF